MSILLRHLSSLSEKESRRFQKFVQSPYFNQEQKLVQLLQLLDPIPETLDREVLHQAIYPELSFDYPRITNLLSDLSQLVEQFLVVEFQQVPSRQRARTQLASFRTHSNHHDWKLIHQKQVKELHSKSFWSEEDLFHRYALEEEVYVSLLEQDQRVNHQQLEQKIEAMDTYYVAVMLKNVCQWLNHQNVLKEKEENLLFKQIISNDKENFIKFYNNDPKFMNAIYKILKLMICVYLNIFDAVKYICNFQKHMFVGTSTKESIRGEFVSLVNWIIYLLEDPSSFLRSLDSNLKKRVYKMISFPKMN